ncbi:MAG: Sir2 family NAD-dependent protein deacetylase, partial [Bacillota bacterium]|nr:Sir2 family NAD-dependent protein deacetylase [Bacillota bacterium]
VKPDVVLYEEGLSGDTLSSAVYYIEHADALIIGGTSLAVYPAAGLIDYFRGQHLVVINRAPTPRDGRATLLINGSIGEIMGQVQVDPSGQ